MTSTATSIICQQNSALNVLNLIVSCSSQEEVTFFYFCDCRLGEHVRPLQAGAGSPGPGGEVPPQTEQAGPGPGLHQLLWHVCCCKLSGNC